MEKLLLIDDEADVQYSFRRIFDSAEIQLTTASSGEEALRIVPKLKPDLVIIGNVIRRVNPEAAAVRERKMPQMSFPAALGSLFLKQRHSVVVAGTHGKTTTSSLMPHVLVEAGKFRTPTSFLPGCLPARSW